MMHLHLLIAMVALLLLPTTAIIVSADDTCLVETVNLGL